MVHVVMVKRDIDPGLLHIIDFLTVKDIDIMLLHCLCTA